MVQVPVKYTDLVGLELLLGVSGRDSHIIVYAEASRVSLSPRMVARWPDNCKGRVDLSSQNHFDALHDCGDCQSGSTVGVLIEISIVISPGEILFLALFCHKGDEFWGVDQPDGLIDSRLKVGEVGDSGVFQQLLSLEAGYDRGGPLGVLGVPAGAFVPVHVGVVEQGQTGLEGEPGQCRS
jgi:hypothetical protein